MPTINDLRQQAATIKNATQVGENTATRVGTTFETIADLLESMGGVANLSTIDIGSIDTLNTTGDMLVGTPNIYTLTMTRGSNTFKVGTLFQFANNGRYDVAQVIVSQYIIDSDGRIDTTSADQEVHIFYRLCKTMNGGSLPTPIGTWTTWTELGGSGGSGVTIDPYPTQNSGNAVSSGGVFERLQDVAPKVDISAIDDIDEYSDMLAGVSPFYVVTKTLSGNVFRIGTLMEFANQGRYILYQILATDYVLNDDGTLDTTLSENGGLKLIWRMKQFSGNPPAGVTIGEWSAWAKFGDSGYKPDNEDIDLNANDQLQFANKAYDASAFSGLGRVYLRKNIVELSLTDKYFDGFVSDVLVQEVGTSSTPDEICFDTTRKMFVARVGLSWYLDWSSDEDYNPITRDVNWNYNGNFYRWNGKELAQWDKTINQLTQAMVNTANTIYHIQYDYDLNGQTITLPAGCVLEFEGGSVKNGILSGALVTPSGKINAKELGCTYNDSTKGAENVARLKILEGVTNAIHLQVTDTLYLGSGYVEISDSIKIDGGGELRVSGFNGFKVIGNVEVENIKVYGSDIYTSGGATSKFIDAQAGTPNDVTIKNCYFKGNVRVLHSSKTTDAELTEYFNNITIEGNTFEDIACQPSSVMFFLSDTNFRTLSFVGNKVHNFLGVFIFCGITNGSEHGDNIANFMATKGRDYYVSDNYVFNDMDFMPWENVVFYTEGEGYFTFLLGEIGECVFENNSISNIISNYSGFATYDSYLSVTNLTYRNNKIKNCINLTGAYNQLLKSKGLHGVGKYLDNIYIVEDLSAYFPNLSINNGVMFKNMEGNTGAGVLIVRGNTFDVHTWAQVDGYSLYFKKAYIIDNYFHARYIGKGTSNISLLGSVSDIVFENNVVEFDDYNAEYTANTIIAPALMVNSSSQGGKRVITIKNNTLKNCIPMRTVYVYNVDTDFEGEISNNVISYTLTRLKLNDVIISNKVSNKLFIHDNTFAQNTSNQQTLRLLNLLLANKCKLRFSITTKTTLHLFIFQSAALSLLYATFGECFNVIFKTYDRTSGRGNVSEVKFTIANNNNTYSISSIKAYNTNYVLGQISSASFILNHAAEEYASSYLMYLHPSGAYVGITSPQMVDNSDFDIDVEVMPKMKVNKYLYHPKSGVTARRPTILDSSDVGFEFFDTTLGKTIFAKSVASDGTPTWVYADGTNV